MSERLLSLSQAAEVLGLRPVNAKTALLRSGGRPAPVNALPWTFTWWESDVLRVKAERDSYVKLSDGEKQHAEAIRLRDANIRELEAELAIGGPVQEHEA